MFAVSDKVNDFSEFAYASVAEISCVSAMALENGDFATLVKRPDLYSTGEGDVFIDSDGDDLWTMIDGNWFMFDPMTCKVSDSDETWESINSNYGPISLLNDYIIY